MACKHPDDKQRVCDARPSAGANFLIITVRCDDCGTSGERYPYARAITAIGDRWRITFISGLALTLACDFRD